MISVNVANGSQFRLNIPYKSGKIYDPQNVLRHANLKNDILTGTITAQNGHRTVFVWKYELLASHRYKCQQSA